MKRNAKKVSQKCVSRVLIFTGLILLQLYGFAVWKIAADPEENKCKGNLFSAPFLNSDTLCHRQQPQTTFGGVHARVFGPRKVDAFPCFEPDRHWRSPSVHRSPAHHGFFMVKELKTGGSTAAGIHLRIARNVARRTTQFEICKVRNDHAAAHKLEYGLRNKTASFLWTVLRDPTQRSISQFFHFEVSRKNIAPTDENFLKYLYESPWIHRYYLRTLSVHQSDFLAPNFDPVKAANDIMLEYDFIGVSERMEETAVALQLLLGLNTGDILFVNAKTSGGYEDVDAPDGKCAITQKSFVSAAMQKYFDSPAWKVMVATDTFLHQAANKSLDMTIERLGRDRFEKALQRFRHAMATVERDCLPNIKLPCTSSGEKVKGNPCLWLDSGCGTDCLDDVAVSLNLNTPAT